MRCVSGAVSCDETVSNDCSGVFLLHMVVQRETHSQRETQRERQTGRQTYMPVTGR